MPGGHRWAPWREPKARPGPCLAFATAIHTLEVDGTVASSRTSEPRRSSLLVHTEVPDALRGRNLGGVLARHALDAGPRGGAEHRPPCPFVAAWIRRHPEYADRQ